MQRLIETSDKGVQFDISESASEVDGVHILAKIKGEFFVPNGVSRNKRFYPSELWEKVISSNSVKQRLSDRLMFGTVGHDGEIGEKGIREGYVSHFMTSLKIENTKGMGEALIVNTTTGRNLLTLLKAGCKLRVSSRANGLFKGEKDGMPVVDPNNYELEGWDFVIEAGFLEANPKLAESLGLQKNEKDGTLLITDKSENVMAEKTMDTVLVQHIVEENGKLKTDLNKITEELDAVKADKDVVEKELADLKAEDEEVTEKLKKLAKYEELGEPEEIEKELEKNEEDEAELEKFRELGDSPEEVKEALSSAKKHLKYIGENFGSIPHIKKALVEALKFKKEVNAIGSISEIKESLATFKKLVEEGEEAKKQEEISALADELDIEKEEVEEMLKAHTAKELRTIHAKLSESLSKKFDNSRYTKTAPRVITEGKDKMDEGKPQGSSRLDRINERLAR